MTPFRVNSDIFPIEVVTRRRTWMARLRDLATALLVLK